MGLVDDQRVVSGQIRISLGLRQQDAVGHHLDIGSLADMVAEADLITDRLADLGMQFLGNPCRQTAARRCGGAGYDRSARPRRGRVPDRAWAVAWSCRSRFRRKRSRPDVHGPRRCPRAARRPANLPGSGLPAPALPAGAACAQNAEAVAAIVAVPGRTAFRQRRAPRAGRACAITQVGLAPSRREFLDEWSRTLKTRNRS